MIFVKFLRWQLLTFSWKIHGLFSPYKSGFWNGQKTLENGFRLKQCLFENFGDRNVEESLTLNCQSCRFTTLISPLNIAKNRRQMSIRITLQIMQSTKIAWEYCNFFGFNFFAYPGPQDSSTSGLGYTPKAEHVKLIWLLSGLV